MLYLFLSFCAGLGITLQAGLNTQLRTALDNPVLASLISFAVGSAALLVCVLVTDGRIPSLTSLTQINWWKWCGGLLGAFYVYAVIMLTPLIGPANMLSLTVLGQLLFSIILEHYGLLGFSIHAASPLRIAGLALLVSGVYLIQKY